jgi:predicted restriction endonuclease
MTLDHINVNGGKYQGMSTDTISWLLMINHTLYVYVRSFLEANELVFLDRSSAQETVPNEILEVIDFIEHVFTVKNWKRELTKNKPMLDRVFGKIGKKEKQDDVRGYEAPIVESRK